MKRHKPKARSWGRHDTCSECPHRKSVYCAGEFVDYCKVDGSVIETPPAYCPYRPGEEKRVCLK